MNPTQEVQATPTDAIPDAISSPESDSAIAQVSSDDQLKEVKSQVLSILSDLFTYVGDFFAEYKKPLINVGLVVGALIAIYLVAAIVDAINDIPLLSPLFELIGIGYTGWFIFRFLLTAENRAEFSKMVGSFTDKVTGKE
ncbi:MAG: CAAD domain-containing protein [Geitlerinemataceae cyanobacterium]